MYEAVEQLLFKNIINEFNFDNYSVNLNES